MMIFLHQIRHMCFEIPNQMVQYSFEVPIPRNSNGICVYDTRGLSSKQEKIFKMLYQWTTKGISHGEMATWDTDDGTKIKDIKPLGRQDSFLRCKIRKVNFVIFVVDVVSVLESIDSNKK